MLRHLRDQKVYQTIMEEEFRNLGRSQSSMNELEGGEQHDDEVETHRVNEGGR